MKFCTVITYAAPKGRYAYVNKAKKLIDVDVRSI